MRITNQMKSFFSALFLLCMIGGAHAQDPHFSQFFASPLTLNPALTGRFDGNFRVAGNYRNQWPTINNAFTTATVSFDMPILANRIPEYDTWGVGIMALTDKTADGILISAWTFSNSPKLLFGYTPINAVKDLCREAPMCAPVGWRETTQGLPYDCINLFNQSHRRL